MSSYKGFDRLWSAAGPHNPHMEGGGVTGSGLASEACSTIPVCMLLQVLGQQCSL